MKIVERQEHEKGKGEELGQWLSGCIGAMATTLPSFLVMPFWFLFIRDYRVVDDSGNDDDSACFFICFVSGGLVWLFVCLIFAIQSAVSHLLAR